MRGRRMLIRRFTHFEAFVQSTFLASFPLLHGDLAMTIATALQFTLPMERRILAFINAVPRFMSFATG